jgi:hypothetical protein
MTDRGDTDTFGGIFWVRAMDGSWRNASAGEACIEITRLRAENIRLREALEMLLGTVDKCQIIEVGAGGMSIDAQIARSFYLRVPVCPFEEAREALEVKP